MNLKDITPKDYMCDKCDKCPAVFETDSGSYVIIGKVLPVSAQQSLRHRIGDDEFVIEVPKGMIDQLIK